MDPKVLAVLGMGGLMFFLFLIVGIVVWINSEEEEDDSSSAATPATGAATSPSTGASTPPAAGSDTPDTPDTPATPGGDETCHDPGIYCIGGINWTESAHHGKDCSEVRPGDLTGLTAESENGFDWIGYAYDGGSTHKLVVKDRYGEACTDKEVACVGTVSWDDSIYDGEDCSAHAIAVNSGSTNKSLESLEALDWCRQAEQFSKGCTIGVVDKN